MQKETKDKDGLCGEKKARTKAHTLSRILPSSSICLPVRLFVSLYVNTGLFWGKGNDSPRMGNEGGDM